MDNKQADPDCVLNSLPDDQQRLLTLDEFLEWVRSTLGSQDRPDPELTMSQIFKRDSLEHLEFLNAFDDLVRELATPSSEVFNASSMRELYMHYLYVCSRPRG
jgi:hypothetical protein